MKKLFFSQKLLSGEAHFFIWRIAARAVGFGNTFLILSALTVYQYGVLQLLLSLYAIAAEFTSLGGGSVGNDIQRLVGEGREAEAKRLFFEHLGLRAILAIIMASVFFFGASILAAYYKENFIIFFRIIALLFLTEFLLLSANALLRVRLAFKQIASRGTVRKVAQFAVLLSFFVMGTFEITHVLFSMAIASVVSSAFLAPALIRSYGPWRRVRAERRWIITALFRAHGKWEIVRTMFHGIVSNVHPWAIKLFIGTEAVGIYNAALALAGVFKNFVVSSTLDTLLAHVAHERERLSLIFTSGIKYLAAAGTAVALVGAPLGAAGIVWFFPDYHAALPLFFILIALTPLHALKGVSDTFLIVLRKQKFSFIQSATRDAVRLGLIASLLPILGLFALPLIEFILTLSVIVGSYRYLVSLYPEFRINARNFFRYTREDKETISAFMHLFSNMVRTKFGNNFPGRRAHKI